MKKQLNYHILSAQVCILACIGDIVILFVLGKYFPGYSQLKDTISHLGSTVSPVSKLISTWSVLLGIIFITFGITFKKVFADKGKISELASWLIILYGIGEGIGSGIFKADQIANLPTTSGIIHEIFGAIGVFSVVILPLIASKVITKEEKSSFQLISKIVFVLGLTLLLLFVFRFSNYKASFLFIYKGLWQRLFLFNIYIYLSTIAFLIIKRQRTHSIGISL